MSYLYFVFSSLEPGGLDDPPPWCSGNCHGCGRCQVNIGWVSDEDGCHTQMGWWVSTRFKGLSHKHIFCSTLLVICVVISSIFISLHLCMYNGALQNKCVLCVSHKHNKKGEQADICSTGGYDKSQLEYVHILNQI